VRSGGVRALRRQSADLVLARRAPRHRPHDARGGQNDYSRSELDNLQRWLTWQYLDLSGFVVGQIARSPRAGAIAAEVADADARAGAALTAYAGCDCAGAIVHARAAYSELVAAATAI